MLHQIAAPFIFLALIVVFCPRLALGIGAGLLFVPRLMGWIGTAVALFVVAAVLAHG